MAADPLVEAVRAHAKAHYSDGGWDYVVECWEDSDIAKAIAGTVTPAEAIAKVARITKVLHEREVEAWVEGGLCRHCGQLHEDGRACDGR